MKILSRLKTKSSFDEKNADFKNIGGGLHFRLASMQSLPVSSNLVHWFQCRATDEGSAPLWYIEAFDDGEIVSEKVLQKAFDEVSKIYKKADEDVEKSLKKLGFKKEEF